MKLIFAATIGLFAAASAQARDLCYKGVIEFDPSSVQFFVTPDKTEYWIARERSGAKARYEIGLTLRPDLSAGEMSLKRLTDDVQLPIASLVDPQRDRHESRSLPLSVLLPDRKGVPMTKLCTRCMGTTLGQADGANDFAFEIWSKDLSSAPEIRIGALRNGEIWVYKDYEVRYCDDNTGYFPYELVSCSQENGLCAVIAKNRDQTSVVQVSETAVAALAQRLPSQTTKATYDTQIGKLSLPSYVFNRAFVSEQGLPKKALDGFAIP